MRPHVYVPKPCPRSVWAAPHSVFLWCKSVYLFRPVYLPPQSRRKGKGFAKSLCKRLWNFITACKLKPLLVLNHHFRKWELIFTEYRKKNWLQKNWWNNDWKWCLLMFFFLTLFPNELQSFSDLKLRRLWLLQCCAGWFGDACGRSETTCARKLHCCQRHLGTAWFTRLQHSLTNACYFKSVDTWHRSITPWAASIGHRNLQLFV